MAKRTAISALWFLAISAAGGPISLMYDLPRTAFFVLGGAGGACVWLALHRYEARVTANSSAAAAPDYLVHAPPVTAVGEA